MSYTAREQSANGGHPLELYRFAMGGRLWLYTSADHEVAYGVDVYQPCYIKRGGFTKGGDARKSSIDIELGASNELALIFRTGWLPALMVVTIYRHHYEDADFSVLWKGRVTGCKWAGSVATLTSDSVFTLFQRAGLRRMYQVGCPHVLFGTSCGLSAASWQVGGIVSGVVGAEVTLTGISAYADGYFLGGMVQAGNDLRMITGHTAGGIAMVDAIDGLAIGDSIILWPGCDRSMAACKDKFANLDNFGGLPFLPTKNPFSGDALV